MCPTHILLGKRRPPCTFEKSLIQTVDKVRELSEIARVA